MITKEELDSLERASKEGSLETSLQWAIMSLKGTLLEMIRTGNVGLPYEADWGLPEPSRLKGELIKLVRQKDGPGYVTPCQRFYFDPKDTLWSVRDLFSRSFVEGMESLDKAKKHALTILQREIVRFMWVETIKTQKLRITRDKALSRIIRVGSELARSYPVKIEKESISDLATLLLDLISCFKDEGQNG